MKDRFLFYTSTPSAFAIGDATFGKKVTEVRFSHVATYGREIVEVYEVRGFSLN